MLLQILFDLGHDMLCSIGSKSALANRSGPLVDALHKVQDELPVGGSSHSAQSLGQFWFGKAMVLAVHDTQCDITSP